MTSAGAFWAGGCLVLAVALAVLSVDGLLNTRGPVKRYVRLFVLAFALAAVPLLVIIVGQLERH